MRIRLSECAASRENNFNLIRLTAASLVLYSHSFALAIGSKESEPLITKLGMTWGSMAVDIFFITSGFLITSSYMARKNVIAFFWARVLRIYPALITAVFLCVFVIGVWLTKINIWDYFSSAQTYKFILKNSTLFFGVEYQLPGLFNSTPWKGTVNGSLWTLPYEVKMYAILAVLLGLIAFLGKRSSAITYKSVLVAVGICSMSLHFINHFQPILPEKFIQLFFMFFVGAAFYVWKDKIWLSSRCFVPALFLVLVSTVNKDAYFILYSLFLPYLIFYIAYMPSGPMLRFNRAGDYSYGIYIYAFPVQQTMAELIPNITVVEMVFYSFVATSILAFFSWHLIEKKFLRMKENYTFIEDFLKRSRIDDKRTPK